MSSSSCSKCVNLYWDWFYLQNYAGLSKNYSILHEEFLGVWSDVSGFRGFHTLQEEDQGFHTWYINFPLRNLGFNVLLLA